VLYFDTSLLVPLILPEATSSKITAFFRTLAADAFTVSHWTLVEFSSLIAREVRMGRLDGAAAMRADARFGEMVEASFTILLPTAGDFTLARQYLRNPETGLRAGDALHLAVAANHHAAAIYSLDKILLRAGTVLRLPVSMGIRTRS